MLTEYPRVLIADDDLGVREIVVAVVRSTLPTAKVTAVTNGKEALDFYRRLGADLLISNFMMPEMDGPTLVGILRAAHDKVPIIMVSGSPEAEIMGRRAGIDRFVHKLDLLGDLPREIRSLLGAERIACLNGFLQG